MNTTEEKSKRLISHSVIPVYCLYDGDGNLLMEGRSDVMTLHKNKLKKKGIFTYIKSLIEIQTHK